MNSRDAPNYGSITQPEQVGFSGAAHHHQSPEVNNLCDTIVTNIYTVNSSWKTLDTALKSIGTKKDNQGLRNKIHVTQLSTNQIASATTRAFAKLKLLTKRANKQQQLQVEKLEENFKEAVNRYYTVQKEVAAKQKTHLLVSVSIENAESLNGNEDHAQQRQEQAIRELTFEQDMLLEREARIQQIESDVLDVNQIMRELGSLVVEQGETVATIENSIDHAVGNVEEGTEQLIKASSYQNKYRRKIVILALICTVIAVILIIVLVVEVKKKQ